MTNPPSIQVRIPTGVFHISEAGVSFRQHTQGDWFMELEKAAEAFDAALRSVQAVLAVTPRLGRALLGTPTKSGGSPVGNDGGHGPSNLAERVIAPPEDGGGNQGNLAGPLEVPPSSIHCAACPSRHDSDVCCCYATPKGQ